MKFVLFALLAPCVCSAQLRWQNVDSAFAPLPKSVHVYFTDQPIDTGNFRAYYLIADVQDKALLVDTDTTWKRRLTPSQFFERDQRPLVVVNGTFFSFETNQNLNAVIHNGNLVSFNAPYKAGDSVTMLPSTKAAIGISKRRNIDVAWTKTDSASGKIFALTEPPVVGTFFAIRDDGKHVTMEPGQKKWKMRTAIGGGPVLLQDGEIKITNNEERRFGGKAINDKHPRTAMGYTPDGKLIILVIEGRNPLAGGASLTQEAMILKDLGCVEALNLDGGGSSCMLINGKQTITPCDKSGQRPVPAVFLIRAK